MKNNFTETIVTLALLSVAVLLLNPFDFWMPDMMVMGMLVAVFVLFGIFASFVMREQVVDEREAHHRGLAGRNAFLAGSAALILGIAVQGYTHTVDMWLVVALVVMVIAKIGTRMWSDTHC